MSTFPHTAYTKAIKLYVRATPPREPQLDFLRMLAALSVILCHATETVYIFTPAFFAEQTLASMLFALTAFTIGRMGVPVFFFLTGYLLLSRRYDDGSCVSFWKRNLLPLLRTTLVWIALYNVFLCLYNGVPLDWKTLLRNLLFLQQVSMGHMWYMYALPGLYLFLPIAARALQAFRPKTFLLPAAIVSVCLFLMPVLRVLFGFGDSFLFDLSWSGGIYGALIAFGYFVKAGCFKKIRSWILALLAILFFAATVALLYYSHAAGRGNNLWYDWGTLIACTCCICELCTRFSSPGRAAFFRKAAAYSFGIYLVHFPVKLLLERHLLLFQSLPANVLWLTTLTALFSWSLVWLVDRFPRAGKFFFLIK